MVWRLHTFNQMTYLSRTMRKTLSAFLLIFPMLVAFNAGDIKIHLDNDSYGPGEHLEYRVHYGLLNAGTAVMKVDKSLYKVNGRSCYQVNVEGRTTGTMDVFMKIRDNWRSYIDTEKLIPQKFYRNIREGSYTKIETTTFDHKNGKVFLEVNRKGKESSGTYDVPKGVQDMVSGYYYLRLLDYGSMKLGDTVTIPAFFEDELYDFRVRFLGREVVDTKLGEIMAVKLVPIMPEQDLFKGEEAIQMFISDDPNHIPLKVRAEMFVGAVELDITEARGLRHPLATVK